MKKNDIIFILNQLEKGEISLQQAREKVLRLLSSSTIGGYKSELKKGDPIDYKYFISYLASDELGLNTPNVLDKKHSSIRHFREQFYFLYGRLDGYATTSTGSLKKVYEKNFEDAGDLYWRIRGKKKGVVTLKELYFFILKNLNIFFYVSETFRMLYDMERMKQHIDDSDEKKEEFISVCNYTFRNL